MNHSKSCMLLPREPAVVSGYTDHIQYVLCGMSYVFVLLFLCVYMFCGAWHGDIKLWVCTHAMVTFIIVDDHDYLFIYFDFLLFYLLLRQGFST